jgi:hypothetical protein
MAGSDARIPACLLFIAARSAALRRPSANTRTASWDALFEDP